MEVNELMKKIQRLEIKAKGLSKHIFSGEYHSAFKGRGMSFSEVRNYQIGDEVRTIDWNVTARFNDPFVKVFEEERELTVMLLIDVSASGLFGSNAKTKKELLLETVAILAFSALSNNDKVGAILVSDKVERYIAPQKGRKHMLYLLRELIAFKASSKGTDLNEGFKFLQSTQKKRTICFVISDFIDEGQFLEGMKVARKRHDLIALKIEDPMEYELPKMGYIQLFNAETGVTTWVDSNDAATQQQFREQFKEHEEKINRELDRMGIDHCLLNTAEDSVLPLVQLFKNR